MAGWEDWFAMQGQLEEKLGAVLAGRYMSLLWANAGKPRPEEGELRESVRRLVTDFHSRPLTIGLGLRLFGIDPLAKPLTIHVVGASHVETLNTRVTDYDELARMFPGQRGMEVVMVGVDVVDGPIMRPPLATPGPQGRIYLSSFKGLYHDFWEGQVETKVAARPDLVVGFHPGECPGCSTRGCWGLWDVPRAHHGCAPCHRGPPQAGGDTLGLGCQQHPKGSLHLGSRSRSWGSAQDPEPGGERGPSLLAASRCASQAFLGWEGQAVCPPLTDTSPQVSTPALTSWQAGCPRCCCCGTTACPPSSPSTGEPPGAPPSGNVPTGKAPATQSRDSSNPSPGSEQELKASLQILVELETHITGYAANPFASLRPEQVYSSPNKAPVYCSSYYITLLGPAASIGELEGGSDED